MQNVNISTVLDRLKPLGAWDALAGTVLGSVATYGALTPVAPTSGTSLFDGLNGGNALLFDGSSTYLHDNANGIGAAILALFNTTGVVIKLSIKSADATAPAGKCLCSCYTNAGVGFEIVLGVNAFSNPDSSQMELSVILSSQAEGTDIIKYPLSSLTALGTNHWHDGKTHEVYVALKLTPWRTGGLRVLMWCDETELTTGSSTWSVNFGTAFSTAGARFSIGARRVNNTVDRYWPGTMQLPAVFGALIEEEGQLDLAYAQYPTPNFIDRAVEFNFNTATLYSSTDNSVPLVDGDQCHYGVSTDGQVIYSALKEGGTGKTLTRATVAKSITAVSQAASAVCTTATNHGYVVNQVIEIGGFTGSGPTINGRRTVTAVGDATHFTIAVNTVGGSTGTATATSHAIITHNGHGLAIGQGLYTKNGPAGMVAATVWRISGVIDANNFQIPTTGISTGGETIDWFINHGAFIRRDEAGIRRAELPNQFARRDWPDDLGNWQYWFDLYYAPKINQGFAGLYLFGGTICGQMIGSGAPLCVCHDDGITLQNPGGSKSPTFGLGFNSDAYTIGGQMYVAAGTAASTDMTPPSCVPGASGMGISQGFFGLATNGQTAVTYCDGVISALSRDMAPGNQERSEKRFVRIGNMDYSSPGASNTVCNSNAMAVYTVQISPNRPITAPEFKRAHAADRAKRGFSSSFVARWINAGDSTSSGEQDFEYLGYLSRTRGLRNWLVHNDSMPGIKHSTYLSGGYDLTALSWQVQLPTCLHDAMGINDANVGDSFQLQTVSCVDIRKAAKRSQGKVYTIQGLTPLSNGVAANTAYDNWAASRASGFDASYRRTAAISGTNSPDGIHGRKAVHDGDAALLSNMIPGAMAALNVSSSGTGSNTAMIPGF